METLLNNINKYFKYIPQAGDKVKITEGSDFSLYTKRFAGKFGEVKEVDKVLMVAKVEFEVELFSKEVIYVCCEDLRPIGQPLLRVDTPKNLMEIRIINTKEEELEPVELDHLSMPTTQDEVEPIDKGEVIDEISKFVNYLKSKGWLLDSLDVELYNQNDEEDYVIVHL